MPKILSYTGSLMFLILVNYYMLLRSDNFIVSSVSFGKNMQFQVKSLRLTTCHLHIINNFTYEK